MKPICPTCNAGIPNARVNLAEGVAHCPGCGEYHRLSHLLRDSVGISRIAKPDDSKIQHYREADSMGFIIPRNGLKGAGCFFLVFALFWNSFVWFAVVDLFRKGEYGMLWFLSIFVAAGLFLIAWVMMTVFAETTIAIDTQEASVIWSIKSLRWRKSTQLDAITEIDEGELYQQNYKPVYGVCIHHGKKQIKFGSNLSEDERRWMIGELRDFKASVPLDR
ncbi:hypothetical protein [Cerasicoccus frondis]|uniref:hypothetical protein n=1 Tax=Cerasicoccus frondis TaxID=490090 RepID=UPI002852CDBC|nr:hypothetical protein [Cerasicoccus frondis]